MRTTENDLEWWRVDDENTETCSCEYSCEIVRVSNNGAPEWESEPSFYRKYVEALYNEDGQIDWFVSSADDQSRGVE